MTSLRSRLDAVLARRRMIAAWTLIIGFFFAVPGVTASATTARPLSYEVLSTQLLAQEGTATGSPMAGALFAAGSTTHSCSGVVIDSPDGDLVVTAAHCISGSGVGMTFAPGYTAGNAPYGTWTVTAAYASSSWLTGESQTDDIAVLRVAPQTTASGAKRSIESVVGGAAIGTTPAAGTTTTVIGYPSGAGGSARLCTTGTTTTKAADGTTYPTFTCGSYPGGTSGGPWLTTVDGTTTLVGVIGGYYQGGCSVSTSYSSPISGRLTSLVAKASAQTAGDIFPTSRSSGC